MNYVLVTVSGGIIDQVQFFTDEKMAIQALAEYVKTMNIEKNDAGLYDSCGMIANAKNFLDENDEYVDGNLMEIPDVKDKKYVIINPNHHLGPMVVSPDDPLVYTDPAEAVSDLSWLRKDYGKHLKIHTLNPVSGPICTISQLEHHHLTQEIGIFDDSLIEEYVMP